MTKSLPNILIALFGFGLGLLVSGCSSNEEPRTSPSAAAISAHQEKALSESRLTWDDYQSTFEDYKACLSRAGFTLDDPHIERDLMEFGVPSAAIDSGDDQRCYSYHWEQVDNAWQLANENNSLSARVIKECREAHGVSPLETYKDNLQLLRDSSIDITERQV